MKQITQRHYDMEKIKELIWVELYPAWTSSVYNYLDLDSAERQSNDLRKRIEKLIGKR